MTQKIDGLQDDAVEDDALRRHLMAPDERMVAVAT